MIFITEEWELRFKFKTQAFYFYAPWMPFHKKMLTMLDKMGGGLSQHQASVQVGQILVDKYVKPMLR